VSRRDDLTDASWVVAGGRPRGPGDPLNHPITAASTFLSGGDHWYARSDGTPTVSALEEVIGGLDGGTAVAFSSGMAAAAAVLDLVPEGGSVALPRDCYHGVASLAERGAEAGRWSLVRVEHDAEWQEALDCDLVWIETPSNPMLHEVDLEVLGNAPRRGVLAVDGTFATPLRLRPLDRGADVVVHSASKLIGGHSDLVLGLAVATSGAVATALRESRALAGGSPGALETFLALRGVRTLRVRLDAMEATARELAVRLRESPQVAAVRYPGFGAVVSFEMADGDAAADRACERVSLIRHTTSLGGVETTMERRSGYPGSAHLPAGLIRMSVGLEDVDDLWADLAVAIA
jgi:cystathionine gamma-synthase